jgi:hypothetical protein
MKTITKTVKLPGSVISGANLRAAVGYNSLTMVFDGITMNVSGTPVFDETTQLWTVVFKGTMTQTQYNSLAGKNVSTELKSDTSTILKFTVTLTTTTIENDTINVTDDGSGNLKATITPSDNGTAVTPTIVSVDVVAVPQFEVNNAKINGMALGQNLTSITEVGSLEPVIELTLSHTPTNLNSATYEVIVTRLGNSTIATNSFSLTNTNSVFEASGSNATVQIRLTGTNYSLSAGKTYKVTLKSNTLKNASGTYLDNPGSYYFKTAQSVNPVTTLNTVTPTTIASGTNKQITMNFSADVKSAPETGSSVTITKDGSTSITLDSSSTDISLTQGTDKSVVTLTITKEITPGTYSVSVNNGLWLDLNGNPIEVTTKTFTVE